MLDSEVDINKLVKVYLKIRNAIDEKETQHKEELASLKEQFGIVGQSLLNLCKEQNLDSIRTPVGTVSRRISTRYWTSDWDSMYRFISEHDAPFLLEQRIHGTNMKEFLESNPEAFPMGMQADRSYTVQVRKPNKI
jgi:hypothetical protein|tara:strand:+ start:101 stop:508 length:408 start_codon:yes stop_codon:yes gene_type:complete